MGPDVPQEHQLELQDLRSENQRLREQLSVRAPALAEPEAPSEPDGCRVEVIIHTAGGILEAGPSIGPEPIGKIYSVN